MKRTYYTTTEYTSKISADNKKNVVNSDGSRWEMFTNKAAAKYDADWIRQMFPEKAKEYGGPKIVKITLSIVKEKK